MLIGESPEELPMTATLPLVNLAPDALDLLREEGVA